MFESPTIREMRNADIGVVTRLGDLSGFSSWKESDYAQELTSGETIALVGTIKEKNRGESFAGFLLARLITPQIEIFNVAVVEEFRKNGIGKALVNKVLNEGRKRSVESIWLEVRESNFAAKALYESCGFVVVGRRKKYYTNPNEDALCMTISLI